MHENYENIIKLVENIKVDKFHVSCYFKCNITNATLVSTVAFEPYNGKIELSWKEMLLHPIDSYNKYYHTPITIYGNSCDETIVLKAFEKVEKHFVWNNELKQYVRNIS